MASTLALASALSLLLLSSSSVAAAAAAATAAAEETEEAAAAAAAAETFAAAEFEAVQAHVTALAQLHELLRVKVAQVSSQLAVASTVCRAPGF
ncbi:MAG: hypothetical protein AAF353_13915 [Pseudomonadota bacterium]